MIAVAGTIGTGLFLGSGASLVVRCDPSQKGLLANPGAEWWTGWLLPRVRHRRQLRRHDDVLPR
jgi:hypothetical protein